MTLFRDEQDVYAVLGTFFRTAAQDQEMGPEIQKSGLVIQFQYSHPDSVLTIDARSSDGGVGHANGGIAGASGRDANDGDARGGDANADGVQYFRILEGAAGSSGLKPDILMTMKADVANKFWLGELNLLAALSRRQIVAKGPIPKILKLLPAIQPAYAKYRAYVESIGRTDLLGS